MRTARQGQTWHAGPWSWKSFGVDSAWKRATHIPALMRRFARGSSRGCSKNSPGFLGQGGGNGVGGEGSRGCGYDRRRRCIQPGMRLLLVLFDGCDFRWMRRREVFACSCSIISPRAASGGRPSSGTCGGGRACCSIREPGGWSRACACPQGHALWRHHPGPFWRRRGRQAARMPLYRRGRAAAAELLQHGCPQALWRRCAVLDRAVFFQGADCTTGHA